MLDFELLSIIGAMTWTVVAFMKHLRAGQYHDAASLLVIVAVGIGVTFLAASSDFADGKEVNGVPLSDLNASSIFMVGYAATSLLRVGYETIKAVAKGAIEPKLVPAANPDP